MSSIFNKEQAICLDDLKDLLAYDPDTGIFTWRKTTGGVVVGSRAGYINSSGYWVVGIAGEKIRQHRLAWFYVNGAWPPETVDHIDGDKKNNAIRNLRAVPQRINHQNIRTATKRSRSGVLGVYWSERRGGYMASLTDEGKQWRRGPYKTINRARSAYLELKRTHHEGCTL